MLYLQALKDAEAMLEKKPGSKVVLTVVNSIKKEMAKLNGKTYRFVKCNVQLFEV